MALLGQISKVREKQLFIDVFVLVHTDCYYGACDGSSQPNTHSQWTFEEGELPLSNDPQDEEEFLEDLMSSALNAKSCCGVTVQHLREIWRIKLDDAKHAHIATMQHCPRTSNPELNGNYSTNYHMFAYKRIHENFFMDTLFAAKKTKKSSCSHFISFPRRHISIRLLSKST